MQDKLYIVNLFYYPKKYSTMTIPKNKYWFLFLTIILLITITGCHKSSSNDNIPPPNLLPTITNFTPANANIGSQVVITGTNFSTSPSGNIVKFNGITASVITASSTQLTASVPVGATTGRITVTVGSQTAAAATDFIVTVTANLPVITSISTTTGRPGDQVIILGANFNNIASFDTVRFNGILAFVTIASPTQLTVRIPAGASSGNISVTVNGLTSTSSITFIISDYQVSTFTGSGVGGLLDNVGTAAKFSYPEGIAKDNSGNLYVADQYNRSVRKITPSGLVSTVATFANPSSTPNGLAVDASGNIYVTERDINIIRKISSSGVISDLTGTGLFNYPLDVAVDAAGNVFVTDWGNRRIRKVTPAGVVTTFAGSDTSLTYDGTGLGSRFIGPRGITIDAAGNLYVTDYSKIRKITPTGVVSTIAGSNAGYADGPALSAMFFNPKGIAIDASGNIFIADKVKIRKLTTDGFVITIAGTGNYGFANGPGSMAEFDYAEGLVVDASGNIFIADNTNNRIRKITF